MPAAARMGNDETRGKEKRRPAHPKVAGRLTRWLPGVRGFTPSVLLPLATAWTASPAVGRSGAPASIPTRPGLATWFTSAGAASRPGRGPASRTAHRGATSVWTRQRDWPRQSRRGDHPDRQTPEPLIASAPSPEFPSVDRSLEAWPRLMGSRPFPQATATKLRVPQNRASAEFSSAYEVRCGSCVEEPTAFSLPRVAHFHAVVELCKSRSHSGST